MPGDNPHDRLFKRTFSVVQNAVPELRAVLPAALLAQSDLSTLKVVPGSFVDEALKSAHSDLLYSIQLSGKPAFIYVLFEHQSSVDRLLPLRLLRYIVRILDQQALKQKGKLPLPVVIPVVLHHSETGWTAARRIEDLFDPELVQEPALAELIPRLSFVLDDISHLSDEALKQRALSQMAALTLWVLRDARTPERFLSTLSYWAGTLVELLHAPNGRQAVETLFRYITAVAELPAEELTRALRAAAPRSEEALMTIAEQLRAEGRAEGRAERGQAVLLRLLSLKFGEIPGSLRERVTQASEQDLDRWTERILTAASLDDVFEQAPSK